MPGARFRTRSALLVLTPLLHCVILPTEDEQLEDWVAEQHLTFVNCGTSTCDPDDPETAAARACIAEARSDCTPARIVSVEFEARVRVEATVFVVPTPDECETHVFVRSSMFPEDTSHIECDRLELDESCMLFGECS